MERFRETHKPSIVTQRKKPRRKPVPIVSPDRSPHAERRINQRIEHVTSDCKDIPEPNENRAT